MNVVVDTDVFLGAAQGFEEPSAVFAKIIRDCDKVIIDGRIVEEYIRVLTREGFNQLVVLLKLQDLHIREKLRNVSGKVMHVDNIVTHEKDRHLIESANVSDAVIITYEKNHLLDRRDAIQTVLGITVKSPPAYLLM